MDLGACLLEESCSQPNRLVVLWGGRGRKGQTAVPRYWHLVAYWRLPCLSRSRWERGRTEGTRESRKSCLQAVSTLVVKTVVFHDVENQLGSGRRPFIS